MRQLNNDDNIESVVLEEEIENYEPTEEEIIEYAGYLGIDIENERELFWVARNGLKAPLPEGWKPCQTKDEEIYYFNFETGESRWDHPCDEFYRKLYLEEKQKYYSRKASSSFQLKDIAAEPITEDDFEDELETCERKNNLRKSERGRDTTQRSQKQGDKKKEYQQQQQQGGGGSISKKQDEGYKNQAVEDLSYQKETNKIVYLSDKKNQKNQGNILNESKLHLSKSPGNLSSSLYASTIEDHSQLFYNNPNLSQKAQQYTNGQGVQKFFNSVKKELDGVQESNSVVVVQQQSQPQVQQIALQKQELIEKDIKYQLTQVQTKLDNEFAIFSQELQNSLDQKKSDIAKQFKDRSSQNNILKERDVASKRNRLLQELQQLQHLEIQNQQESLQRYLQDQTFNLQNDTKVYEEEVQQICISQIEQIQSEIKDLKQFKEEQQKGIQNIEQDHLETLKNLQQNFEKQKVEVNQKIQDQIKQAIEKEQTNFEKDLESFQVIWEQQFQIQEMSHVEEEAHKQTVKLELDKRFKEYQIDLQREQENKRYHVFDRIRKEEILHFEKNKMKKKQEYELILEEKKLEIQKLLASQETLSEKEVKQIENKHKEKYEEFLQTQLKQYENKIAQQEKEKISLVEQIQSGEPQCQNINNLDLELHQIIANLQMSIDALNDNKYQFIEDIGIISNSMIDIQNQKQEQETVLNDINIQILNQENINQQLAFQQNVNSRNQDEDQRVEKKLKKTLEQFKSNNPLANYFSGSNSVNGNLFVGEQNSFGYKIDESSILNNDDIQNYTEIEKIQREVEELKTIIQKDDHNLNDNKYYQNKENNPNENMERQQENRYKTQNNVYQNGNTSITNKYTSIGNDREYNDMFQKREQLVRDRKQFLYQQQQNVIQGKPSNDSLTQNILTMMDEKINKTNLKLKQYESEIILSKQYQTKRSNLKNKVSKSRSHQYNYYGHQQEEQDDDQIQIEGFSRIM